MWEPKHMTNRSTFFFFFSILFFRFVCVDGCSFHFIFSFFDSRWLDSPMCASVCVWVFDILWYVLMLFWIEWFLCVSLYFDANKLVCVCHKVCDNFTFTARKQENSKMSFCLRLPNILFSLYRCACGMPWKTNIFIAILVHRNSRRCCCMW